MSQRVGALSLFAAAMVVCSSAYPQDSCYGRHDARCRYEQATTQARSQILGSYRDAFGRAPSGDEMNYWVSIPSNDPRIAGFESGGQYPASLFQAHLNWLQTPGNAEQKAAARRALHEAFKQEEAAYPQVKTYIDSEPNVAVQTAVTDMLARRQGGGYIGLLTYLRQPEVQQNYLENVGILRSEGFVRLRNAFSFSTPLCMQPVPVTVGGKVDTGPLELAPCGAATPPVIKDNSIFRVPSPGSVGVIATRGGLCLDGRNFPLQLLPCDRNRPSQRWSFNGNGPLISQSGAGCVDIGMQPPSDVNMTKTGLAVSDCKGTASQNWTILP